MANFIPENIQSLLSTYIFEVDPDCSNEDLTCVICNNLLHDAYQNICECKYCRKCIVSYMNDGNEYCPGGKEECREDLLVIDRTAFPSTVLNKKVLKVRVRCPNKSCQFTSTLTQMEDHLRVCSHQPMECPFTMIGCTNETVNRDSVETHLNRETLAHSRMLMEVVDNLKNEVERLKEELRANKLEMASFREECQLKEREIREEMGALAAMVEELKGEVAALNGQMDFVEEVVQEKTAGIIDERTDNLTEAVDSLSMRINDEVVVGSLWFKVEGFDWLRKTGGTIDSPHLYSHINGYKLRIQINILSSPYGGLHVSSIICKGEYNDALSWPARGLSVSVSLINHRTKKTYKTETIKYDNQYCSKPIEKDNEPYGRVRLAHVSTLASTDGLIVSDSFLLLVKARFP